MLAGPEPDARRQRIRNVYDLRAMAKVATVDVGQQAGGIAFWKTEPVK